MYVPFTQKIRTPLPSVRITPCTSQKPKSKCLFLFSLVPVVHISPDREFSCNFPFTTFLYDSRLRLWLLFSSKTLSSHSNYSLFSLPFSLRHPLILPFFLLFLHVSSIFLLIPSPSPSFFSPFLRISLHPLLFFSVPSSHFPFLLL